MNFTNWKDYAELVGILAIVASLIFVGLQLRQTQAIAISEMNAALQSNAIEVNNAIRENADIWIRGNAGDELSPPETTIFERLVVDVDEAAYYGVQQQLLLGLDEVTALDIATFAGYLYENPGARRVWSAHEQRLARYRGAVVPGENLTSDWVEAIESSWAAFDRQAGFAGQ